MVANNRKKSFRSLGKEQISVEKPPKKEATERGAEIYRYRIPTIGGHKRR